MRLNRRLLSTHCRAIILLGVMVTAPGHASVPVLDPATSVPILHEVDVVVIGSPAGAIVAATEAARAGASVFVAAPRTYLGEDIASTYRYALEPGEVPQTDLERSVFWTGPADFERSGRALRFGYRSSRNAWSGRPDTTDGTTLRDGKWGDHRTQSLQYDGDVGFVIDLGEARHIEEVEVRVYQRRGDCRVDSMIVSTSGDGVTWRERVRVENSVPATQVAMDVALPITATPAVETRFLRLELAKASDAERLLVGEIILLGKEQTGAASIAAAALPTPNQVKRALDAALVGAKIPFLYSTAPTELLVDQQGRASGVVIANQSGRQAILAKVVIDATEHALLARWAGARISSEAGSDAKVYRKVVGGPMRSGPRVTRRAGVPREVIDNKGRRHEVHDYEITLPAAKDVAAAMETEQIARDLTWTPQSVDAAERLFRVPTEWIAGRSASIAAEFDPATMSLDALRPTGVEGMFVLGGHADLPRAAAAKLLRPLTLMTVGARVGRAAAAEAKTVASSGQFRVARPPGTTPTLGLRFPTAEGNFRAGGARLSVSAPSWPVLAEYDVIVVGGGTGGAPAAIAAASGGARTAVVEFLDQLGGVGTAGMVSLYYNGNPVGYSEEIDAGVATLGGTLPSKGTSLEWLPAIKAEWLRQEARRRGVSVWFSTLVLGAVVERGAVRGVVVSTPWGPGVIRAKVIIDSTGNAAVAAAAGAECTYTGSDEIAVQGTGLPARFLEARYINTDYTYVDETDIVDIWRAFVVGREKFKAAYDLGQLIDTRERRRIVGEMELKPTDAVLRRTWPDTVTIALSDFDSHGYTVDPLFLIRQPDRTKYEVPIPYRCLLPRGLDGILVTGLGISVHRDSLPLVRMQRDIQNQGYAAGTAAAMAAHAGISPRAVPMRDLQQHLVAKKILPASAVQEGDSFPLSQERIRGAVARVVKNYEEIAVILSHRPQALPLLREAFATADPAAQLTYAHILGMLGDSTGASVLSAEVARSDWDTGWNFKGMGQYGASLSRVDSLVIALGRTRSREAVPVLLAKARQLTPASAFSHFRAISLALEAVADPAVGPTLANVLALPGVSGHSVRTIERALQDVPPGNVDNVTRGRELTEIGLARALYRSGDYEGTGERILRSYRDDLRGHYARHVRAVLDAQPPAKLSSP